MSNVNITKACNVALMLDGTKAIPRTCKQCGLGPCPHYTRTQAQDANRDWSIGVSSDGPQVAPLACPMPDVKPARITCGAAHDFAGYECTRNKGHLGPCALVPVQEGEYAETRDEIGQLINDALAGIETQVDAVEITLIAEAVIAKLRPELIPVAKPAVKNPGTLDAQLVFDYLNARDEYDRMHERTTWTGALKHRTSLGERMRQGNKVHDLHAAMLASEKEVTE